MTKTKKTQMTNVTNEDITEYIKSTSEVLEGVVKAIEVLNKRLYTLEDTVSKLDRILGNMAIK